MGVWKKHTDVNDDIAKIDDFIRQSLKANQQVLNEAINDLLSAGGKRLRPALVLLSGRFGKYNEKELIPLAAAIEILHMATLVHDDVIDESDMRRGRPTARSRWDNATAVFTGDFLFSRAFDLVTRSISQKNMHRLSNAIRAICEGEVDQFQSRYESLFSTVNYLKRISRKTGRLFALSCEGGAEESRCKKASVRFLRKFGHDFGMAFQITDDILDFTGNQKEMGKSLCCDFAEGIYTLPVIYTMQNPQFKDQLVVYTGRRDLTEIEIQKVGKLVGESGGIERSGAMAMRYLDRCRNSLDNLPDIPAKAAMQELTNELMTRRY